MYKIGLKILLCVTLFTSTLFSAMADTPEEIEFKRQNRGLVEMAQLFVPKGQWIVGATASYSTHINSDYNFLIIEDIISEGYNITASPYVSYAIKDNLTVGAAMEYGRTLLRVDNATLSVGDDLNVSIYDIYSISQSFLGIATIRQYIPIGNTNRFSLFTEGQIGLGGTRAKYAFDSPVQGTYAKSVDLSVNVVPGIVAFATPDIAFEVSIGALGLSYRHTEQIQNQVYMGSVDSSSMSFTLNLFSIGLGVAFYL